MIRRALIPFIAVCAALGVGIALGGGPLSDRSDAGTAPGSVTSRTHDDLVAQAQAGQKLAAATAGLLTSGKLTGKPVAIAALPGAPQSVLDAFTAQVAAAGGTVTSTLRLTGTATDPASKSLVDTLGAQMASQVHGIIDGTQPPYVRLGQLLGGGVATTGTAAAPSTDAATTLATLVESRLATVTGAADSKQPAVQSTAPLLLFVLGNHVDPAILAGIVQGAATRAHGVVVAGSTGSGLRGDLKRLRAHDLGAQAPTVATVDGDETKVGQIGTVLALVHQITGGGGAYGASGIDGVAPLR